MFSSLRTNSKSSIKKFDVSPLEVTKRKERYVSVALFFLPSSLTLKLTLKFSYIALFFQCECED